MRDNRIPQYYRVQAYPKGSLSTRRQADICYISGVVTSSRGRCPLVEWSLTMRQDAALGTWGSIKDDTSSKDEVFRAT